MKRIAPRLMLSLIGLWSLGCGEMLEADQECPALGLGTGCDETPHPQDNRPKLVCGEDPIIDMYICLETCVSDGDCSSDKECTPAARTDQMACTHRIDAYD